MHKYIVLVVLVTVLALTATTVFAAPPPDGPPGLEKAIASQEKHNPGLLSTAGVVGTAVGVRQDGKYIIKIFTDRAGRGNIPRELDGITVEVEMTGKFMALAPPEGKGKVSTPKTTDWWTRPVPIGISTGNANEISAGTIGARVKAGSVLYSLSNNHVYARENAAAKGVEGEEVLQPGLYDGVYANSHLGTLSDYIPIVFGGTNTIDAAIAETTADLLGKATPAGGYGIPKSATVSPSLNLAVQKYGRTTRLTKGTIYLINYSGYIGYSSGTAYFTNQFVVLGSKPFVKAGDSGSLVVTISRNPVGLLFAGDASGKYGICNDINEVLTALGVSIDGELPLP